MVGARPADSMMTARSSDAQCLQDPAFARESETRQPVVSAAQVSACRVASLALHSLDRGLVGCFAPALVALMHLSSQLVSHAEISPVSSPHSTARLRHASCGLRTWPRASTARSEEIFVPRTSSRTCRRYMGTVRYGEAKINSLHMGMRSLGKPAPVADVIHY